MKTISATAERIHLPLLYCFPLNMEMVKVNKVLHSFLSAFYARARQSDREGSHLIYGLEK